MKDAFSLVELLVVIAILCLLVALLFPLLMSVRGTALRVVCANNLRQVGLVCHAFTQDHNGILPQCNSGNPHTIKFKVGTVIDEFMKDNSIPPDIWYCPGIKASWNRPESWMSHDTLWNQFDAFPIGYFYVGNPGKNQYYKFLKPVPRNVNNIDLKVEFIFDYCVTWRPSPVQGSQVEEWCTFPHFSTQHPDGAQVMMSDFSLEYRHKNELTLGYEYFAPYNVFW
jgi:prepilin-type N-terminal cleavage/methylation domain-containing protein